MSTIGLAVMLVAAGPAFQEDGQPGAGQAAAIPVAAGQPVPSPAAPAADPGPAVPAADPPPLEAPVAVPVPAQAPAPASAEGDNVIIVSADPRASRVDPLAGINVASFEAIEAIDKAVVAPVAGNYEKIVPKPVRNGLRNVLANLAEPIVFLNYLLQFKPGKALETVARFGINSTIGVAGLFDMAKRKPFHLPYRPNGFANTFAYHGIGNGPYLFLPVLGPTTARDLVGRLLDVAVVPTAVGSPFNTSAYSIGTGVVKSLNDRVEFDGNIAANRSSADPYVATRDFYLKRRQAEIDALHSAAYRARKGIPDPVSPPVPAIPEAPVPVPVEPAP
ncbi:VacJ family lipoprotein [Novosphingobium sp. BL-52-GroH]|uniref:MlaA family lipoprotein n=1 Tax=Novosphingobium sp. BL-52-GroH TaxID=3349877 RepID=UPI00384AEF20